MGAAAAPVHQLGPRTFGTLGNPFGAHAGQLETTPTDDDTVGKWKVTGPLGTSFEWTARLTEDEAPNRLAWSTTDDADNEFSTSGSVHFTDLGDHRTRVVITLDYQPPAGKLGEAVAALFDNPQRKVEQAAAEFKTIVENR